MDRKTSKLTMESSPFTGGCHSPSDSIIRHSNRTGQRTKLSSSKLLMNTQEERVNSPAHMNIALSSLIWRADLSVLGLTRPDVEFLAQRQL